MGNFAIWLIPQLKLAGKRRMNAITEVDKDGDLPPPPDNGLDSQR
jgi:hypothetical protein